MRPSLLPGLLAAVQRNRNRGFADVALFEVGQAYRGDGPKDQFIAASGVRAGAAALAGAGRHWAGAAKDADMFDAKADVVRAAGRARLRCGRAQLTREAPAWFHPGRSGALRLGPKVVLAHFGELHPETLRALDVAGPVAAFEVFIDALPAERKKGLARGGARGRRPAAGAPRLRLRARCATCRPATSSGRRCRADKKLIAGVSVFDLFEGAEPRRGQEVARRSR